MSAILDGFPALQNERSRAVNVSRKTLAMVVGALCCGLCVSSCALWQDAAWTLPPDINTDGLHRVNVNFNDQVALLGYKITPEDTLKPGETCTLVWYWKVIEPLEGEWKQFTHITRDGRHIAQNIDGRGHIRKSFRPGQWKAGALVVDRQVFTLREDYKAPKAIIVCGIYGKDGRLKIIDGPNNGRGGAIGPVLKTGVAPAPKKKK
jgi:hypothetical protein